MFDYLHLLLILALPLLLHSLKTFHRGLVTGLFLSLLYWGVLFPIMVLVPISAAVFLCFHQSLLPADFSADQEHVYIRKPSQRVFMTFLLFMVFFCAFGDAVFLYGTYIKTAPHLLQFSHVLGTFGLFIGPLLTGFCCDRRGTFPTAVLLTLLAELAIWFAAFGQTDGRLWLIGWFLQQTVVSGFLTLVPLISLTIIGHSHFLKIYPEIAIILITTWAAADYLYSRSPGFTQNPGDLLMTLVFLPLFAVFFIVIAWQKRFVLVAPIESL